VRDPVGDGLATIGHDLLQPLFAARLSLAALGDSMHTAGDRTLLGRAQHALIKLEEQLLGALEVEKLRSGAITPNVVAVPIEAMFKSLQTLLLPMALADGIELTHTPTALVARTDSRLLQRVLQHLIINAIKYAGAGRIRLIANPRPDHIRIEVWDSGPGIEPDELTHIFGRFKRGRCAGQSRHGGHGLGLYIVGSIAERLRHRVGVFSRVGRGSCFWIEVPLGDLAAVQRLEGPKEAAGTSLRGVRVLVVEPDGPTRAGLRLLLLGWGCEIIVRTGIDEVAQLSDLQLATFDLVMLNVDCIDPNALEQQFVGRTQSPRPMPSFIGFAAGDPDEVPPRQGVVEVVTTPIRPAELRSLMVHLVAAAASV
jgi:CheY-like chemotaxis protein